jgi:hypothetical protein
MSSEEAWSEARRDVTALGEQLRQHYETGGPEEAAKRAHRRAPADSPAEPAAGWTATASAERPRAEVLIPSRNPPPT